MRHETLTFERELPAPPEVVFNAYADVDARARWSAPSDSVVVVYTLHDLRIGGLDRYRCGEARDPRFEGMVQYVDLVVGSRIVYTEVIARAGKPLSVSLVTWELAPTTTGTRLVVTVQLTSLVGEGMVTGTKVGMAAALDRLGAAVAR
jgi:uncharacterized protein YndB with AHSA1/START domain